MIDLIVKPGYIASAEEAYDLVIDATQQPEIEWLRKLREALDIPSRERRISRRAVLGVGITSLAALGGMGLAGKLLFFTPPSRQSLSAHWSPAHRDRAARRIAHSLDLLALIPNQTGTPPV